MEKENIVKAISDPALVRRAFTAIREDPGPLTLVYEETDGAWGYDVVSRIYHNGKKDYIIVTDFGPCDPGRATMLSMGSLAKWLNKNWMMDEDIVASCIAVVIDDNLDQYRAKSYPLVAEYTRSDGVSERRKFSGTDGWISLVLGRDVESIEEVIQDLEHRKHGD